MLYDDSDAESPYTVLFSHGIASGTIYKGTENTLIDPSWRLTQVLEYNNFYGMLFITRNNSSKLICEWKVQRVEIIDTWTKGTVMNTARHLLSLSNAAKIDVCDYCGHLY